MVVSSRMRRKGEPAAVIVAGWCYPPEALWGISADRALDRMPVLTDALQDAGCEDAHILGGWSTGRSREPSAAQVR
jgi:hypothetical protein